MPRSGPPARSLFARLARYLREDFREIVWPRSMPDPPSYRPRKLRELTFEEHREVWLEAIETWKESWRNVFRRQEAQEEAGAEESEEGDREMGEASTSEDSSEVLEEGRLLTDEAKKTLRTSKAGFKPFVTYLYETRGRAYRDGVREFINAYREGFKEVRSEYENGREESFSSKTVSMISKVEDILEKAEKTETSSEEDVSEEDKERRVKDSA